MEQQFYNTIETPASTEYKDRGSTFIAYAFPLINTGDFKKIVNELKKTHPKATHYCFAYRIGNDKNNYRVSDAGEPSGTAGKPILAQIDSKQLTNILVVVIRYFGGTLLGVPGLINAYKSAAALVLQLTPIVQKAVEVVYRLQFDYTQINEVMMIIKQCNCSIIEKDIRLFCYIKLAIPINRQDEVLYRLGEIRGLSVEK
jgi:uncharacterized YigZ family protein